MRIKILDNKKEQQALVNYRERVGKGTICYRTVVYNSELNKWESIDHKDIRIKYYGISKTEGFELEHILANHEHDIPRNWVYINDGYQYFLDATDMYVPTYVKQVKYLYPYSQIIWKFKKMTSWVHHVVSTTPFKMREIPAFNVPGDEVETDAYVLAEKYASKIPSNWIYCWSKVQNTRGVFVDAEHPYAKDYSKSSFFRLRVKKP